MHIYISHGHRQQSDKCWDGWELGGVGQQRDDGGDNMLNNKDIF